MAAITADDVWAVGATVTCDPFTCYSGSEIQHWNGSRWSVVPHPLVAELRGVDAAAADDVWAVGTNNLGTVIEHWDGSGWSIVPSPDPESGGALNDVDAELPGAMWSSGFFYDDVQQRTLTVQAPSATQGQVVGDVDVSQAVVSWFGPATGSTLADTFGSYAIPGLPAGRYTITVTDQYDTCDPASAQVRISANKTAVVDFDLDCSV